MTHSVAENRMMADLAVKYVKKHMPLGASNKGVNYFWRATGLWTTKAHRCRSGVIEDRKAFEKSAVRSNFEIVRFTANRALLGGCGNCTEQAMAAFMYLYNKNIRPLHLLSCPGIHTFVVLGLAADSDIQRVGTWGKNAVVCDPWDDESYPALLRPLKMSSVSGKQMSTSMLLHRAT